METERIVIRPKRRKCKCCVMPETPGFIEIGDDGICNICKERGVGTVEKSEDTFDKLDSQKKLSILQKKVDRFKTGGQYDCVCSVSGGKDSIMTLYIAKKILGLNPLAVMIDSGFALKEMPENLANATDILGIDSIIFKMFDIQDIFRLFLQSGKRIYYCRLCHALLDLKIHDIAKRYGVNLILGGYTKGQQYIQKSELFWIYEESDKNTVDVLKDHPKYDYVLELYKNQTGYFRKHFPTIAQISPFKYIEWNEDEILRILTTELKFKRSAMSWPINSSNCLFNHVAQYMVEKDFGYAQHEVELSELVRAGEMTRERALEISESPIYESAVRDSLDKLGLKYEDIMGGYTNA